MKLRTKVVGRMEELRGKGMGVCGLDQKCIVYMYKILNQC